jgi:putative ABC transport system permease protein
LTVSLLAALRHRIHRLLRPEAHARELREEIEFHLSLDAMHVDTPESEYAARRRFGNVTKYQEETREMTGLGFLEMAWQDIRFALRTFRHAPTFTAVAALTIALGIGATAAIFSVVHAVILEPLPYPEADRIVAVWMDNRRQNLREDVHSYLNLADIKKQNKVLSHLAPYVEVGYNLTGSGEPQRVTAGGLPAEAFAAMGVQPLIGRLYAASSEVTGSDGVVVLSYGLWQSAFAGDKNIIGRSVELNGRKREVVAVMPPGFGFPSERTQLWVPLVIPDVVKSEPYRSSFSYPAIGRLAPGVSLERARAELSGIAARLEKEYPEINRNYGVFVNPLPHQIVGPTLRTALWIMLGAVAAVLLIACANVANLLLSRAAVREKEVTVRLALGASSGRLVRQLLTESLLLSALGGAAGMALAWVGLRVFRAVAPADLPRLDTVSIDGTVLAVTSLVTIATGLLFGLVPALRSSRGGLSESLRDGGRGGTSGRGGQRLRRGIVVAQLATVVVLLTGAGLLMRTFMTLQSVELGFDAKNVLTMTLQLPGARYGQRGQAQAFYTQLLDRIAAMPGVKAVGTVTTVMLTRTPNSTGIYAEGRPRRPEDNEVTIDMASAGFFRAIGARLVAGREFTAADRDSAPRVAIINQQMAKYYWKGDAVGKRFRFGGETSDSLQAPWITVVGVIGDMRRTGVDMPVREESFLPYAQSPRTSNMILVRTTSDDPLSLTPSVRSAVRAIDAAQPIANVQTLEQQLARLVAQRRFNMVLVGVFASLALALAMIGAYGVTSYLVSQRTREIGVRLALGAEPSRVARLVVFDGMRVALAGVALGIVGAMLTTRLAAGLLYGVSPRDPLTIVGVATVLLAVAAVANYLPARRAARVDPLVALRQE